MLYLRKIKFSKISIYLDYFFKKFEIKEIENWSWFFRDDVYKEEIYIKGYKVIKWLKLILMIWKVIKIFFKIISIVKRLIDVSFE